MPLDPAAFPLPSAAETGTRAALAWVLAEGILDGAELAAASGPLEWNPNPQWLYPPNWDGGVFMIHLVWRATPMLRLDTIREHPHHVETRTTIHLPAHVLAAGD